MLTARPRRLTARHIRLAFVSLLLVWFVYTGWFVWSYWSGDEDDFDVDFEVDNDDSSHIVVEEDDGEVDGDSITEEDVPASSSSLEEEEKDDESNTLPTASSSPIITTHYYDFSKSSSSFWSGGAAGFGAPFAERASSWSMRSVDWFLLDHCAVYSASMNDRMVMDGGVCCPVAPLATRLRQLASAGSSSPCAPSLPHSSYVSPALLDWLERADSEAAGGGDDADEDDLADASLLLLHHAADGVSPARLVTAIEARQAKMLQRHQHQQLTTSASSSSSPHVMLVEHVRHKNDLLLLHGRQFLLRALLFPDIRGSGGDDDAAAASAVLGGGHLSLLSILQAELPYQPASTTTTTGRAVAGDARMYSPTQPVADVCLEHIPQTLPVEVLVQRMQHIAALMLQSMGSSASALAPGSRVLGEPLCIDFEWTKDSRVLLKAWGPLSQCQLTPQSLRQHHTASSSCEQQEARWWFHADQLGQIVRGEEEDVEMMIPLSCTTTTTSNTNADKYEELLAARRRVDQDIRARVFPLHAKTLHDYQAGIVSPLPGGGEEQQATAHGNKCGQCGYLNHALARRCDLCGARLVSVIAAGGGAGGGVPVAAATGREAFRQRLVSIFSKYDPGRLSSVDVLLDRYGGEEDALVQRVESQYRALNLV